MANLDAAFSALADPTRRAILARLAKGEATVNELAKPFEMTQPAISQHLKVLEDAGLIVQRVEGTKRPRRLANAGILNFVEGGNEEDDAYAQAAGNSLDYTASFQAHIHDLHALTWIVVAEALLVCRVKMRNGALDILLEWDG